uniref:Uncharacterized protein n=1 Tax=Amphilophus citrinellus TaxID=61819 RepID=A0A3Q0S3G9_AMPCI
LLAGAFGLSAAKYQYAIDRYHRDHKVIRSQTFKQAEPGNLSPGCDGSRYGATGDVSSSTDPQESCDEERMARKEGCHNKGYQADEHHLK